MRGTVVSLPFTSSEQCAVVPAVYPCPQLTGSEKVGISDMPPPSWFVLSTFYRLWSVRLKVFAGCVGSPDSAAPLLLCGWEH